MAPTRAARTTAPAVLVALLVGSLLAVAAAPVAAEPGFPDVPPTHPAHDDVAWVADAGLLLGYADGTFRPDAPLSRQALAAALHRRSGDPLPACDPAPFPDVAAGHPFCGEIAWLATAGITTGYADGTFRGVVPVSHQAMAAMAYRLLVPDPRPALACEAAAFPDVPVGHQFCGEITWLARQGLAPWAADGPFLPAAPLTRAEAAGLLRGMAALPDDPGTPLPMGGTTNFLGTARLATAGDPASTYAPEGLALSINGKCTSKLQGDRLAAGWLTAERCTGPTNPEYDPGGYTYAIDVPPGRTEPVDVLVFDGAYIPDGSLRQSAGLPSGFYFPEDFNPGGTSRTDVAMRTRFRLLQPDATPEDPSDDPSMAGADACVASDPGADGEHTFEPPARPDHVGATRDAVIAETNTTFAPMANPSPDPDAAFHTTSAGWFNLCRIPANAPGTYLLQVDHLDEPTRGSNNFAVVARTPGDDRLCTRAADPTCPTVGTPRWLSFRAVGLAVQPIPAADVDAADAGRVLHLELWDPAEGAIALQLVHQAADGTRTYATFDWAATDGSSQDGVTTLALSPQAGQFNGHLVTMETVVPTGGGRFFVEYRYVASATDRATLSADLRPVGSLRAGPDALADAAPAPPDDVPPDGAAGRAVPAS